jgi:hypothetical protein
MRPSSGRALPRFDAEAIAAQVRDRLWLYIGSHSDTAMLEPVVEELLLLERGDVRRLGALHLLLSDQMSLVVDAAERLLRVLPASAKRVDMETVGSVRMPVQWERTLVRQRSTADPTRFVCRPPERRYDTTLARLIELALRTCLDLASLADVEPAGPASPGAAIARRVEAATRLRAHAKLRHVTRVKSLPSRTLETIKRRPDALALAEFVKRAHQVASDVDTSEIRDVISRVLSPQRPDVLFELFVGFKVLDALVGHGLRLTRLRPVPGRRMPFAKFISADGDEYELWWHRAIWVSHADKSFSAYADVLRAARLRTSPLIPDFLLVRRPSLRVLMIEVKLTEQETGTPDRRGIQDALGYVKDAERFLLRVPEPHALVVAWNSAATPTEHRIVVSSEARVQEALEVVLGTWARSELQPHTYA